MNKLNVKHFLGIYKVRLQMQKEGITNPTPEIKELTQTIVDKLSKLPADEIAALVLFISVMNMFTRINVSTKQLTAEWA